MDLYIRTQDKMNLVKVNQVCVNYQNNNQIIANYIPDFIGTQGEYYEALGTYATEERALEVLQEIQEHRDVLLCLELMPNSKKIQGIKEFQKAN